MRTPPRSSTSPRCRARSCCELRRARKSWAKRPVKNTKSVSPLATLVVIWEEVRLRVTWMTRYNLAKRSTMKRRATGRQGGRKVTSYRLRRNTLLWTSRWALTVCWFCKNGWRSCWWWWHGRPWLGSPRTSPANNAHSGDKVNELQPLLKVDFLLMICCISVIWIFDILTTYFSCVFLRVCQGQNWPNYFNITTAV